MYVIQERFRDVLISLDYKNVYDENNLPIEILVSKL